jgi:pyrroline-5-carboxylate reductase
MSPHTQIEGELAVIGGGRMGEAIVGGLLRAGAIDASRVAVAEPDAARREVLRAAHPVRVVEDAGEAAAGADTLILAVKPQVIADVSACLAEAVRPGALVVSIAAGVTTAQLESLLPPGTPVVRVMPNTPAMVGEGMSVISGGSGASPEQVGLVRDAFSSLGRAEVLDERYQDAATAISGSGPAYMALFVEALARAGTEHGLARSMSEELAVQTMRGTAELLASGGLSPEALIEAVSSPGGTTVAAVGVLEERDVPGAIAEAVGAAVARARELGR